ncbi:Phenylalanine-4-hydroxylase [Piscirickettsia salmonis]|uniref:phenylalanine 4-monooxygenase n=1 Tax=Piscirickettsia salmonis TaxID=1238 RepID=UPI0012B88A86|nr:phenylalanine 4-monooxygenase [Piscirickettsia salmonis]QGP48751.1 Phenylalanine-4-hydroxylase [Piscirickettsia salmonis]QGP52777.1 Phenylalanine-4-hydroxylase [Piscirickettsia salmonis]QGP57640.1 Phenylalanine-4-hydroxylase [Piscirickettsia salmonis]QGP62345.1 Phenylalanine-4-hydroxylase [Piscirickettsia salmonis]
MHIYQAKVPDANGFIDFSMDEHQVWHTLFQRQEKIIQNRACDEFIHGLALLELPNDRIPQPQDISKILTKLTGWSIEPVPAIIPAHQFFSLLANKKFPAASFIRRYEDLEYLKEPDIFHEIFGHCPLLTHPAYANFLEYYGKLALQASGAQLKLLERLFWFTIEFGLIRSNQGLRIYGGGILSSIQETQFSLESKEALRHPFDITTVMATDYRYDHIQPNYFIINQLEDLYELMALDLLALTAQQLELATHHQASKSEKIF